MATWFRCYRLDLSGQKGSAIPLLLECVFVQSVVGLCLDATIREPEFTPRTPSIKLSSHSLEDSHAAGEYGPRGQLASGHTLSTISPPFEGLRVWIVLRSPSDMFAFPFQ